MRRTILFALSLFALSMSGFAQYSVTGSIPIQGQGGWDYLYADSGSRMLYVSHTGQVDVVDMDADKVVGTITGMKRIHGIAIDSDANRGFISDGGDNMVVVFDATSRQVLQKVKAGTNPDAILYDPASKRVFAFNGKSQDATVIDAAGGNVAGNIPLGGKPEFAVSDGEGSIFDNLEDKNEIVKIDAKDMKVLGHWPLAGCDEPSGLAYDKSNKRLFAVCDNKKMAVVDAGSGKVVATVDIGNGPDAVAFDPDHKMIFSSNGEDGTLTVVKQESADKYSVAGTVTTEKSGRTLAFDSKTRKIYISAAKFGERPAATADNPHPRPKMEEGSFHLVVLSAK